MEEEIRQICGRWHSVKQLMSNPTVSLAEASNKVAELVARTFRDCGEAFVLQQRLCVLERMYCEYSRRAEEEKAAVLLRFGEQGNEYQLVTRPDPNKFAEISKQALRSARTELARIAEARSEFPDLEQVKKQFANDVLVKLVSHFLDSFSPDLLGDRFQDCGELHHYKYMLIKELGHDMAKIADQLLADPSGANVRKPQRRRAKQGIEKQLELSLISENQKEGTAYG